MQRKSSNNNKYLSFYLSYKKSFFVQKHSLKKVVYTKERLYLKWNEHHLKFLSKKKKKLNQELPHFPRNFSSALLNCQ